MTTQKQKNQNGAALLLYLLIMVFVIAILMTATYSRLLLSLKRGQSTVDTLATHYQAESEVYDMIARLSGGYIVQNPININDVKKVGDTTITIKGTQSGDTQTISVTADRPYASSKIVATRQVQSISSINSIDIILSLDCTGSMKSPADPNSKLVPKPTRMDALKSATLGFIQALETLGVNKVRLGVDIFGTSVAWLKTEYADSAGKDITPSSLIPITDVEAAIHNGFGNVGGTEVATATRENSPACQTVSDGTSVGTAFVFPQDYFAQNKKFGVKQIEVIITDGEPNARTAYPSCLPNRACTNLGSCDPDGFDFLRCAVSTTDTSLPAYDIYPAGARKGVRNAEIDTYAVTISTSPTGTAADILTEQLHDNYYPIAKASSLPNILSNIFTDIVTKQEKITIHKELPG